MALSRHHRVEVSNKTPERYFLFINEPIRAVVVKAQVSKGSNVLITGIGGGVALLALQICLAKGAFVYVTSGSDEKIRKAVDLGAKAGVNYKSRKVSSTVSFVP